MGAAAASSGGAALISALRDQGQDPRPWHETVSGEGQVGYRAGFQGDFFPRGCWDTRLPRNGPSLEAASAPGAFRRLSRGQSGIAGASVQGHELAP